MGLAGGHDAFDPQAGTPDFSRGSL